MTTALLERKLKAFREPIRNKVLQRLLVDFPPRPMQSALMHRHYSMALEIILEAVESGELEGTAKEAAEKFVGIVAPFVRDYEKKSISSKEPEHSDILRFLMEQHGLRQEDLGPDLGGQSVVSDVLRGRRKLNVEQISRLCARFNISPATFFPPAD